MGKHPTKFGVNFIKSFSITRMNKPKQHKRWQAKFKWPEGVDGGLSHSVKSQEHLALLGEIIVDFGHLEQNLRHVLTALLGAGSNFAAGIIFDTVISAQARIKMMERLLQERPENSDMPKEIDELIAEYASINDRRNKLVHGLWYTSDNSETFLSKTDGLGLSFMEARIISVGELSGLRDDIANLNRRIWNWLIPFATNGDD